MLTPLVYLLVATLIALVMVWLFVPDKGFYWKYRKMMGLTDRMRVDDAVKFIYYRKLDDNTPSEQDIANAIEVSLSDAARVIRLMQESDLVEVKQDGITLTPEGDKAALHLIRAHRLWESHLADRTSVPESEWHEQAHILEHSLSPEQVQALANELGNPAYDPHGDPIPDKEGNIERTAGTPVYDLDAGASAVITLLNDKLPDVYSQISAAGLRPGMYIKMLEKNEKRAAFWADGEQIVLAPEAARNVFVAKIEKTEMAQPENVSTLATVSPGQMAEVVGISAKSRGAEKRRFMDLGILPGTKICAEMASAGGDPVAYKVREALIALRKDQAEKILIDKNSITGCN